MAQFEENFDNLYMMANVCSLMNEMDQQLQDESLFEEIVFDEDQEHHQNVWIQFRARDQAIQFVHRDDFVRYVWERCTLTHEYIMYEFEPENAPIGVKCKLSFRFMDTLVDYLYKHHCSCI